MVFYYYNKYEITIKQKLYTVKERNPVEYVGVDILYEK
jgi:hypothetical protein